MAEPVSTTTVVVKVVTTVVSDPKIRKVILWIIAAILSPIIIIIVFVVMLFSQTTEQANSIVEYVFNDEVLPENFSISTQSNIINMRECFIVIEESYAEIADDLDSLQAEVGGLIQCVYLDDGNIAVINDEGKINGSEPNRWIADDIICGPFFICGDDGEDFASLSDQDLEKYKKEFEQVPKFSGDEQELEPHIEVWGFNW